MKNKGKLLISVLTALVFSFINILPTTAEAVSTKTQVQAVLPTSVISNFIKSNYTIDSTCPWTENTKENERIPTYNLDNTVIGYILNLSTNGEPNGFIVYDISASEPVVIEFGYHDVYLIEEEEVTNTKLGHSKLIPVGMNEYFVENDDEIYTIKTHTNVTDKKTIVQQAINENKESVSKCIQKHKGISKSAISSNLITTTSSSQIIYSSTNVPNLWKYGYQPVTMQMYGNKGCSVVAGVNLLKYWHVCRGINSLYNSYDTGSSGVELQQTYSRLWKSMKTDSDGGTTSKNGYNGISSYCSTYACNPPKGRDFKNSFDWNWYKTNINNGNFMIVDAAERNYENDGRKGNHSFSGVGYQETSTGNYMRVGDQWSTHYSHFFNVSAYSYDIHDMWYWRW